MSDWRDVMAARDYADSKVKAALEHAAQGPHAGANQPYALLIAVTFCAQAVCAELRALGTTIDYRNGA